MIWNLCSWMAYIAIAFIILGMVVPPFIMLYVQSEIKAGNWVNVEQSANITSKIEFMNQTSTSGDALDLDALKRQQRERRE